MNTLQTSELHTLKRWVISQALKTQGVMIGHCIWLTKAWSLRIEGHEQYSCFLLKHVWLQITPSWGQESSKELRGHFSQALLAIARSIFWPSVPQEENLNMSFTLNINVSDYSTFPNGVRCLQDFLFQVYNVGKGIATSMILKGLFTSPASYG